MPAPLDRLRHRIRHGPRVEAPPRPPGPADPAPARVVERPAPRDGLNHLVFVVFDSLRFDAAVAAGMPNMSRLGPIQRRYSYATWTAPSHFNLLMGLLPHTSPPRVYASDLYQEDLLRYGERLGVADLDLRALLPSLYLPKYLHDTLGYETRAAVSLPVLNPASVLNNAFDSFRLADRHNDMAALLDGVSFTGDRPTFHLLNVGETHYPYARADEDPSEWPRISGVHGVVKHLDVAVAGSVDFFDDDQLERLRARQVDAAREVDRHLGRLFDEAPPNTWFVVTADHGELFGEGGYFGHGPIMHEKVHEVPFVEGPRP